MQNAGFLNDLLNYDSESLEEPTIKEISKYLDDPRFEPEHIKTKLNMVAGNLAYWVKAMRELYEVNLVVRPKQAQLAEAKKAFAEVDAVLKVKQAELKTVVDKVNGLERTLKNLQDDMQQLVDDIADCEAKLIRA